MPRSPRDQSLPYTIGYVCHYPDEPDRALREQIHAINCAKPYRILFEHSAAFPGLLGVSKKIYVTRERPAFNLLMRGLMHGDVVFVSDLSRLGRTAADIYDALTMLRRNEIRVLNFDPDGTREWRPAVTMALREINRFAKRIKKRRYISRTFAKANAMFRGAGWTQLKYGIGTPMRGAFIPNEGARTVARHVVKQHDESGVSYDDLAAKLNAQGVFYVGCLPTQVEPFDAANVEEYYLSCKAGFPYPSPSIPV